ncbi:MAG: four helix bundle protein [Chitinophagales bacterium]
MLDASVLRERLKVFSINVIKLVRTFPKTQDAYVIGNQLIKSATSSAANYRAALLARSNKEFYAKICIVTEEIDESYFWLDICIESDLLVNEEIVELRKEAFELLKIFSSTKSSLKKKISQQ